MTQDWIVRVYNEDNEIIEEFEILDRTEQEALKEAEADVERMDCDDWTMTPKE